MACYKHTQDMSIKVNFHYFPHLNDLLSIYNDFSDTVWVNWPMKERHFYTLQVFQCGCQHLTTVALHRKHTHTHTHTHT